MVMSLPPSGLPSTVTLPVTSARRSPHPEHARSAPRQRNRTRIGRTRSQPRPRVKEELDMVRLAGTYVGLRTGESVFGTSGDWRLVERRPFSWAILDSAPKVQRWAFCVTV